MNRYLLSTLGTLCMASLAHAQQPYPGQGAGPSPYLNLLRGGSQALNYYGLVKPQVQNQNAFLGFQQQFNAFTESATNQPSEIRATGHGATFMYYSHFYTRFPGNRSGNSGGQPNRR